MNNELLKHPERGRTRSAEEGEREAGLSLKVEQLATEQYERFGRIERYLTVKRREAIRTKLEREKQQLLRIIDAAARAAESQQTTALILNKAFFRLKTIDTSLLE